ncbi:Unknown protein, partial [Striga hermonthica]
VNWLPYERKPHEVEPRTLYFGYLRYRDIVEPYMPLRCLRQLGYVQIVPLGIYRLTQVNRPCESQSYTVEHADNAAEDSWNQFSVPHSLHLSDFTETPVDDRGQTHRDYLRWYERVYHPRLLPQTLPDADAIPARANYDY